nr:MAG TPA: tail tape measure [Caudoviricetes sp.]
MSTTVDNRVVQMRFDNEEFEKKASKSLSTLDRLKNALKFSGASKNLDKVNKSFKEVDANPLLKAIEGINGGLTTIVAKATLVNRATNALIDTTKRFVSSMTLDQVNAGWDKYAEKTSAVQTIMAATSKDFKDTGVQMSYVNDQLQKLNWFTDETSYNFTDMVGNIGKFTSNSIKLDKSVTAMQGIATWAARSGANANEASRAMYNLSQALSTGAVKLIDWKSIENANMATAEFKENVIEAAVALGKLKKKGDGTYVTMKNNAVSVQNFNNALSDAWFTSDVLLNVLDRYGGFTNKLYEVASATDLTATQLLSAVDKYAAGTLDLQSYASMTGVDVEELRGYLDELSSSTYELGRKSFQSAQEAKTFAEAISATSDAVSTGWMRTFELIFGDYEEAKKLWTNLANILYEVFAASGDVRNELFEGWREGGGRKTMLEGINETMEAILRIVKPFKDAFRDIFPAKTSKDLLNFTNGFKKLMKALQLNSRQMTNLRRAARGVFSVFDILFSTLKQLGNIIKNLVAPELGSFGDLVLEILGSIGDLLYSFRNIILSGEKLNVSFEKIGSGAKKLIDILKNLFIQFKNSKIGQTAFKLLVTVIESGAKAASKLFNYISETVSKIKGIDKLTFPNLIGIFSQIGKDTWDWLKGLTTGITDTNGLLENFKSTVENVCNKTGASFDNLTRRISIVFNALRGWLKDVPWGALLSIAFGLGIIKSINNFTKAMTQFATAIGNLTSGFAGLMTGVNKVMTSVAGMFDAIKNSINAPTYLRIAKAIAILAGSLTVLALLPTDKLQNAAVMLTATMVAFAIFVKALTLMPTLAATGAAAASILAKVVAALAASLLILAAAFKMLEETDPNVLMDNVLAITVLVGVLATAATLMTNKIGLLTAATGNTGVLNSAAANILAMSASVYIIAKALKNISDISFRDINSVINALVLATASVIGLSVALSKLKGTSQLKSAGAILTTVLALSAVLKLIQKLENYDMDDIWGVIKKLGLMIAALAAVFAATNLAGANAAKAGAMMAGLGLGLYAIMAAIGLLGNFKTQTLVKGITAVGFLSIFMGVLVAFTKLAGKEAHKVSLTLLAAAAAIGVLSVIAGIVGHLDTGAMIKGLAYVAGLSAIFIAMIAVTKNATDMSKSITTMTVAAVALGTMVAALSIAMKDSPDALKIATQSLAMLLVAFGFMSALSAKAQVSIKSIAILTLAVGGLATILGLLVTLVPNLSQAIQAATGVTILASAMSGMAVALSASSAGLIALGAGGPTSLIGVGIVLLALIGVCTTLGIILAIINALNVPDDLPQKCLTIAQALGNLVAGFVAGGIGTSITILGESIKAFNDSMSNVKFDQISSGIKAIIAFAGGLAILATVGLFELFVGAPDLEEFKMQCGLLGQSLTAYSQGLVGCDVDAIINSLPAVNALVEITNAIPKQGGLFNLFTGTQNLAGFGLQLVLFGAALTGYSLAVKLCDNNAIAASLPGTQALVQIANTIPDWSIFGFFFGTKDLALFGTQLVAFGDAMASYAWSVSGIDFGAISQSIVGARALVEIANALPDDNILARFVGKQNLDNFGETVAKFGRHIAKYYQNLSGIAIDNMTTGSIITDLHRLIEFLPEVQAVSVKQLTEFSSEIANFGWNLWQFFSYTAQVQDPTPLDILCQNVVQSIAALREYIGQFRQAGQDCVAGFLEGVAGNESLETVKTSGSNLGNAFLIGFRGVTGWHSPWSTMIQAGWDAIKGLFLPTEDKAAKAPGENLGNKTLQGYNEVTNGQFEARGAAAADEIASGAVANGDKAESAGSYLGAKLLHGIDKAGNKLSDVGKNISTKVKDSFKDEYAGVDKNGGLLSILGLGFDTSETKSSNATVSALSNTISNTVSAATSGSSNSLKASGAKAADTFLTAFENKLSDLDLDLSTIDLEQNLWEATIGQKATDQEKQDREAEVLAEKIKIQNEKVDQANQKYEYTVKKFGKTSEDAKKAYQELLQEQIDLANLMNSINKTRDTSVDNSTDAMVAYAQYIAESKDDLLKLGFTMEQISAAASEQTGYNLQNTTQNMTDSVTTAVTTAMSTVQSTYAANAESTLGTLTSNFASYGAKYSTAVGSGMTSATSAVTEGAKNVTAAAKSTISGDYKQWYSLGQMCAEGFKQGILFKSKEIADAAAAVANAAFSAVQVAIDSHSPSRKFMWLGEMAGLGMSIGFQNMEKNVAHSATQVANETITAARDTIGQLADIIDTDPTLHPQIAPVIDLAQVRSGFNKLGSMKTPVISTYVTGARVNAVASSLSSHENGMKQPVPQNNQNGPQVVEFVQNNYSPKSLSRSEIYRNTNNQFTAFKEAISRV